LALRRKYDTAGGFTFRVLGWRWGRVYTNVSHHVANFTFLGFGVGGVGFSQLFASCSKFDTADGFTF
jgi:hypothetical protein